MVKNKSQTKAKHAFIQRFSRFDEDIDLVDYLVNALQSKELSKNGGFLDGDISKYNVLKRRAKNKGAYQKNRILLSTHLKQTIYSSYIKDTYEEVLNYVKSIIQNALKSQKILNKEKIVGNNNVKLTAIEILKLGSLENVLDELSSRVFQSLENERDTLKLFEQICKRLGLDEVYKGNIENYIDLLNVRHFLVHQDGHCSEEFINKVDPNLFSFDEKGCIKLNFEFIQKFRTNIIVFIELLDTAVIELDILDQKFIHLK